MNPDMIDHLAITRLLHRYAVAADRRDAAMLDGCFLADARFQSPGFEIDHDHGQAIAEGLSAQFDITMHNVHTHHHEVTGDRANGVTYCTAVHLKEGDGGPIKWEWYFRYHDELVRTGDGWRFASRRLEVLATTTAMVQPSR